MTAQEDSFIAARLRPVLEQIKAGKTTFGPPSNDPGREVQEGRQLDSIIKVLQHAEHCGLISGLRTRKNGRCPEYNYRAASVVGGLTLAGEARLAADSDNANSPSGAEKQEKELPPSRIRARAAYEYGLGVIAGADKMIVAELFDALRTRLDMEITKANGRQAEQLQEFRDSLPDNAETFGKYLREAGIKRYAPKGEKTPSRSIRLQSEI